MTVDIGIAQRVARVRASEETAQRRRRISGNLATQAEGEEEYDPKL